MIEEKIRENIRALVQINGMTMQELEKKIGRPTGSLSRKRMRITIDDVEKVCNHFGITLDDIVTMDYDHQLKMDAATNALLAAIKDARVYYYPDVLLTMVGKFVNEGDPDV